MRDDNLIEAMAIAIHEQAWGPWEEADDGERTDARDSARAALAALQETHAVVPRECEAAMASSGPRSGHSVEVWFKDREGALEFYAALRAMGDEVA